MIRTGHESINLVENSSGYLARENPSLQLQGRWIVLNVR